MACKPRRYTSVAPCLFVDEAEAALAFAARVFGAETLRVIRRDDGTIKHAAFRIDGTTGWLGRADG